MIDSKVHTRVHTKNCRNLFLKFKKEKEEKELEGWSDPDKTDFRFVALAHGIVQILREGEYTFWSEV